MSLGNIGLLILVSLLTCSGQICQKQAVNYWKKTNASYKKTFVMIWLVGAVFLLVIGMVFWLRLLQFLPLSIAYPMLSINFVVITLIGQFLYREKAGTRHWIGVLTIMLGILLMSLNQ
ncbi:MAG: EamA family transporter [Enterobacteriaceae bacterium]|jgi:undecaprenyl phosphate-alpha-L-ara4N flippase subunit ArnE|nr:EamA family transporter [Enterobacteriaceae bacterium]